MNGSRTRPDARLALLALALLACAAAAGCGSDGVSPPEPVPQYLSLEFSPDTLLLPAVSARFQTEVTAILEDGSRADVTTLGSTIYLSGDPAVVGIGGGTASAAGEGTTFLVAAGGGRSDTIRVVVDESQAIPPGEIVASRDTLSLRPGVSLSLGATVRWPNGSWLVASGPPFAYAISDPTVAQVSPNGTYRGVARGTAEAVVSFRDMSAAVPVSVVAEPTIRFDSAVLPIFQTSCTHIGCHPGSESLIPQRGLRLNSYASVMAGGDNGPVVEPGDSGHSRLVRALLGTLPGTHRMPLGGSLSNGAIETIALWIDEGACVSPEDCPVDAP